ncbi:pilus assembly protein TadG-related protein [Monashia sp. NPDC004114]
MRWLNLRFGKPAGEQGAVATLVAILAATGVIMGMLALSVDVGNIMFERRQLQNATDATSLALAQACSNGQTGAGQACASAADASTRLKPLANANSKDALTRVPDTGICGNNVPTLPACTSPGVASQMSECNPLNDSMDPNTKYVETRTYTESGGGATVLPKFFSQAITGGGGGTTVTACARAAWGPIGASNPSLPLVLGICNWNQATANGTKFAPSPPYTPAPGDPTATAPNPDVDGDGSGDIWPRMTQIFAHVNGSETAALAAKFPCGQDLSAQSGQLTPGGFGWVKTCKTMANPPAACDNVTDNCLAAFLSNGTIESDPGASMPTDCKTVLPGFVGKEVDIPVITAVTGTGGSAVFTVNGISTFFVAGMSGIPGVADVVAYNDNVAAYRDSTCIDTSTTQYKRYQSTCMWGWFTSPIRPVGSIGGGTTGRGPTTIAPAG